MKLADLPTADEVFADQDTDPTERARWGRSALARAVALTVIGYRMKHKLSQTALARKLGMRQPNVARLEAGDTTPSLETLLRLSAELELRFVMDVSPSSQAAPIALPAGLQIVQDVIPGRRGRVLVATG